MAIILKELKQFNIEGAIHDFQPKEFAKRGIYPDIWRQEAKEELQEELKECFFHLVAFYEKAMKQKKAVIVSIY